jgi:alpha-L-fucosidase
VEEVIDKYHPDLIWFDSWLDEIPEDYQMEMAKYYFNDAVNLGKEVVLTVKQTDMPLEVAVEDFEKGRADSMRPDAWLTDDTLSKGSWCYTEDLQIKPLKEVLHSFIDIVSKNGQLLLNISPKADGTIPQDQRDVLLAMGKWLDMFGGAIYGTRPFVVYGEGPTQLQKGGHFIKEVEYTPQDIRYTKKANTVYAILLGNPGGGTEIVLNEFGNGGAAENFHVKDVVMMGSNASLVWEQTNGGIRIVCPNRVPDETAFVFAMDVEVVE